MSRAQRKETTTDNAKPYEPTPQEREAVESLVTRRKETVQAPHLKVTSKAEGAQQLTLDHPDVAVASTIFMTAIGTTDFDFFDALLGQLSNVASKGQKVDEVALNFMRSVISGIEPKDQLEAMLATQMAAVHLATMTFARRLNHVDNLPQQDSAERAFNKLARTFAAQMEALKRYRSTGEQRMTVEHQHVTVNEGGKAIVGNVTTGGGMPENNEDQPLASQITHAPGETLPSNLKAIKETVLLAGG